MLHAAVGARGRPRRLILRPGHRADAPVAAALVAGFAPAMRLADAACDSNALRNALIERGRLPVIPSNPTRKNRRPFDRRACRVRDVIERASARLEDWRRIATRYDKLAWNFHAAVCIAASVA